MEQHHLLGVQLKDIVVDTFIPLSLSRRTTSGSGRGPSMWFYPKCIMSTWHEHHNGPPSTGGIHGGPLESFVCPLLPPPLPLRTRLSLQQIVDPMGIWDV